MSNKGVRIIVKYTFTVYALRSVIKSNYDIVRYGDESNKGVLTFDGAEMCVYIVWFHLHGASASCIVMDCLKFKKIHVIVEPIDVTPLDATGDTTHL